MLSTVKNRNPSILPAAALRGLQSTPASKIATQARSKERPSSEATAEALGILHHAGPLTVVHQSTAEAHIAVAVPDGGRSAIIDVLPARP